MALTYPNSVTTVATIPGTGIHPIGSPITGTVNVMLEGAVTGTLGFYNTAGTFVPYADGAVLANSSTVIDCGAYVKLAIDAVGAGTVRVVGV